MAATSKGGLKKTKKTVVNQGKDSEVLQTTNTEEKDIPADQKGHDEGSNVDPEAGPMLDEAFDIKPDLDSLNSSLAKGSDYVEPSQESVAFAAEVLAELGDAVHIQEHVATPTAANESNWPPKHSYKTFVKDFQTEEEGENANSLSEDSNIIPDTQEMGQTVSKSKIPLPGGFIVPESKEDEEGNDEQSVSDIPEGERKDKPEDDQENPRTYRGQESLPIKQYRHRINYRCGC